VVRLGGRAAVFPTDVANADEVDRAADAAEAALGPIDVWVNNAMATIFAPVTKITPEEFRRATEVTYLGTVHGTMTALRLMRPRDAGVIVQVGSALSYRAIPLQSAYCGAKFAIRGFTDSLRTELLHDRSGIRLTMVQLPGLNTTQFTWARTRMPRELFVGASSVKAIRGTQLAPGIADRYLARTGFDSQQMQDVPVDPDRPDNLFEPVPDEAATHGRFDDQEKRRSPETWLSTHRRLIGAGIAGAVAAVGLGRLRS
jgi:NAD(P)-dependent dehydrogenase (short-subunit alcohol dehydrogenase family)